jgi:hypothetical protein
MQVVYTSIKNSNVDSQTFLGEEMNEKSLQEAFDNCRESLCQGKFIPLKQIALKLKQQSMPRRKIERKLAKVLRESELCNNIVSSPVHKEVPKMPQPAMTQTRLNFAKLSKLIEPQPRPEPLASPDASAFLCSRKLDTNPSRH